MAVNKYETVIILNAVLEEQQIEAEITKISDYLKNHGAEIWDIERLGRKRLAYAIRKSRSGYYVIFRYDADASIIDDFGKILSITENVFRFFTVKLTKEALEYLNETKTKSTQETVKEEEKANIQQES
ncbi:MAG TPA: 30S ribosomal protein S6 [Ignavibacteriales bacterium]|nr:30S ribosomal protein S6 [Ignavibacteriales bacterium]HOL81859.1 30S ribosomal protein S6 [Ignavibacteriales bacterium]HOM65040.1 30S ribosomal protein S6 [Ignavibacteriales bacterium]HPD67228.1 30S ribosomal protein S6 [Ignavibacteriales bacterium]HPP34004.1 30S ribosomal protein S6 [Ignavibacteriales bacterium]